MVTSETINEIAAALAKAQSEIQNVTKDAKNPHFKNDYATLDAVTDTVRPVFSRHGLAVMQMPTFAEGVVTVETLLTHSSGQWIRGTSSAPIQKADPQGVGSATTYLRRYSLAAIAAIAQTDDDGHAASQVPSSKPAAVPAKAPKGYDEFLLDLNAAADTGPETFGEAWKAAPESLRTYATQHDMAKLKAMKAKAATVAA